MYVSLFHSQTYTNPATPGASYENPATPGNFRVDSPHGSYTNPFTPGSTRTPLYHSDYTAHSPLANITPSPANSYDSPGMINPLTPGANYDGMCVYAHVRVHVCNMSNVYACVLHHLHVCICVFVTRFTKSGLIIHTVSRHAFHHHLTGRSMNQQHMCLILLKVEQSAFT